MKNKNTFDASGTSWASDLALDLDLESGEGLHIIFEPEGPEDEIWPSDVSYIDKYARSDPGKFSKKGQA